MQLSYVFALLGLMALQANELDAISQSCMECICEIEGCEKNIGKCNQDGSSLACGPYQIHQDYWIDCGKPGTDWKTCTKEMDCSEKCVKAYTSRYGRRCPNKPATCKDYARIHNGGPGRCKPQNRKRENDLVRYWAKVGGCCKTKGDC